MKINKLLLLLAAVILFAASCTKNEESAVIPTPEVNAAEDLVIAADVVANNFLVESATKVQGTPPTPNGNISVAISTTEQSAFLKAGFNIEFAQNNSVTGAYIQILETDGTPSSTYFDVPSSGFSTDFNNPSGKDTKLFAAKNGDDDQSSINVDFDLNMSPGTFCYVICFYDDEGNISTPEEICVEVESWGGYDALVGDWMFDRSVSEDEGEVIAGEESCETYVDEIQCTNGGFLDIDYCRTIEVDLLMNEDGSYRLTQSGNSTDLDYEASIDSCTAIYVQETEEYVTMGSWAYDEEEGRLTLVEFELDDNGEEVSELLIDGAVSVTGSNMEISDDYDDELTVYYFSK